MLGLLTSVIELVDEVADAEDEILAGKSWEDVVHAKLRKG
jgi:hypothetical protein